MPTTWTNTSRSSPNTPRAASDLRRIPSMPTAPRKPGQTRRLFRTEPDVALLRRRPEGYGAAHPTPADVLLVIEVAHSSLEYDRNIKAHIYISGRSGVLETWVRNLPEDCIERFTEPGADGYARHTVHRRGETLTPVALPDLELAVSTLLPS